MVTQVFSTSELRRKNIIVGAFNNLINIFLGHETFLFTLFLRALCIFVSADKQFVSLRLYQYSQIDYQPISERHYLQGETAAQAAVVFGL